MNYIEINKEIMDKLNLMTEEERNAIIQEVYKIVLNVSNEFQIFEIQPQENKI